MRRYKGHGLKQNPRIGLMANDSLGNFVVSTPLAKMLKVAHPGCVLTLFSGSRVCELTEGNGLFDQVVDIYGPNAIENLRSHATPSQDWVINMERSPLAMITSALLVDNDGFVTGPCLSADGRGELDYEDTPEGHLLADKDWMSVDVTSRHDILRTGFIGEIFCRSAYLQGEIPEYSVPRLDPGEVPDVLIATAASLPDKLWPVEKWISLIKELNHQGFSVGLLGAKPSDQAKFYKGANAESEIVESAPIKDLRGALSLPEVVGALDKAQFVVTLDNGILHLAAATKTPTFGLFRNGIHRLWAPPVPQLKVIEPGEGGTVESLSVERILEEIKNFQLSLTIF